MKRKLIFTMILLLIPYFIVKADSVSNYVYILAEDCNYVLGDLNDSHSPAYLLQEIFDVFKYAAPICVLVFSTIDYIKSVANQSKEDVAKTTSKTAKRLILAAILYFLPTLINFLFGLLRWTGTCGIK